MAEGVASYAVQIVTMVREIDENLLFHTFLRLPDYFRCGGETETTAWHAFDIERRQFTHAQNNNVIIMWRKMFYFSVGKRYVMLEYAKVFKYIPVAIRDYGMLI